MNDSIIFVSEFGKLYTFTREGKFVSQISRKGEGPEEYIVLSSFYIDNKKQQVTIIDNYKNVLINYDFMGNIYPQFLCQQGPFRVVITLF